jgi:hypothetical protein
MKKNQIDQSNQNVENMSNEPAPENKEFPEKKPAENDPYINDPARKDKPPLIISKL